jgi:hypothetical protein
MAITTSGTTLTFNDSTTQTTAPVNTNANVNSVAAGTGISVSATTGALTVTNSGVTSAVAGTGISVSGATGAVTVTNSGVTSLNGSTGALNGMTYISNGSFGSTAVSNNYITGLPSGYTFFKIFSTVKFNGVDGNGGGLALRLSKDNGSTYYSSGYATGQLSGSGAGTDTSYTSTGTGQNKIWICNTPGGSSNTWVNIDITIFNAQGTNTVPPSVLVYASGMSNGGDYCYINMTGGNNSSITANQYINAVQLFIDSGSSKQMNGGYYYVYGMK